MQTSGWTSDWADDGADGGTGEDSVVLDCSGCELQERPECDDCVVRFLCGREPGDAVVVDADEARALRMLGRVGLVPRLGTGRRTG